MSTEYIFGLIFHPICHRRSYEGICGFVFWIIPKKENKEKINVEKTTFYNFDILNAQITRKNFFFL
jgi:hypothetical protein